MTKSTYSLATVVLLGLSLSACEKPSAPDKADIKAATFPSKVDQTQAPTPAPPPQLVIETGSPDLTVKSWWRLLDLREKINTAECNKNVELKARPAYAAYYSKIIQADVLRALTPNGNGCLEDIYERDIQEVKTESETRAIVFAKITNTTPIPVGAEPDELDKRTRRDGFRFKYLVEKTSEGWKVSQVYRYDESNKYLKKDLWEKVYVVSDKPSYPAYVFVH